LLNASVGAQRVLGRLRRPQSPSPATFRAEPIVGPRRLRPAARPMTPARRRRVPGIAVPALSMRSVLVPVLALRQGFLQLGHERTVAVSVAAGTPSPAAAKGGTADPEITLPDRNPTAAEKAVADVKPSQAVADSDKTAPSTAKATR